jgi:hypothetical protein
MDVRNAYQKIIALLVSADISSIKIINATILVLQEHLLTPQQTLVKDVRYTVCLVMQEEHVNPVVSTLILEWFQVLVQFVFLK